MGAGHRKSHGVVSALVTFATLICLISSPALAQWNSATGFHRAIPATNLAWVNVGPLSTAEPISSQFWGLDLEAAHGLNATDALRISAANVSYLRYPGGDDSEGLNYTSGIIWGPSGSMTRATTNVSQFVDFARTHGFHSMLELPAEINNSAVAASDVSYVENTLHFTPDYWEIGYEPSSWTHFNSPWPTWATTQTGNTTPAGFASLVQRYIFAVRTVDFNTPIVALGSGLGVHDSVPWVRALAQVDGPELAAITVHVYPAGAGPTGGADLTGFFSTLHGAHSLSNVLANDSAAIIAGCPTCANLKLFVNEINAATGNGSYTPIMGSFNGTLYLAVEATDGLNEHVENQDWFCYAANYRGAWERPSGAPQSQYYLFANVTSQLGPELLPSSLTGPGGLSAVATTNGSRDAILIVNTNTTAGVSLNLSQAGFNSTLPLTETYWDNTTAQPQQLSVPFGALPFLPPLSLALFTGKHSVAPRVSGPFPVVFSEKGLPEGTQWSVALNNTTETSHSPAIVFDAKNGSYRFVARSLVLYDPHPSSGKVVVAGRATLENISFTLAPQYPVTFTETGLPAGANWSMTLASTTVNSSTATIVFAERNGSFAFTTGVVSGYAASVLQGTVNVSGASVNQTVGFSPITAPGGGTSTFWAGGLTLIIVVLVAVLVSLVVLRLWLGHRLRRSSAQKSRDLGPAAVPDGVRKSRP